MKVSNMAKKNIRDFTTEDTMILKKAMQTISGGR